MQMGADGVARAARETTVELLCSHLGATSLADEEELHEPSDISPALVLSSGVTPFSSLSNGEGSLFQVPIDDAHLAGSMGIGGGGGGGSGAKLGG